MDTINVLRRKTNQLRPGLYFQFDYWLLLIVGALLLLGLLMVYSSTFDYGFRFRDDATYFMRRQFLAAVIGLVGMGGVMLFDYHLFRKLSVPLMVLTLGLLAGLLFFGEAIYGATRGLYEGSYQPSELAKLATILYISHWLSSKGERIKDLTYGLLPFSMITGVVCALIVRQPDLGTSILIALTSFTIFFVAGADWRQFGLAGLIGGTAFVFLMLTLPHARARVDAYTEALADPNQAHWQVQQSLIALGSGNWFGVGIGRGTQKFGPLPFAHTDGIFAVLGEELGFFGTVLVVVLFALLIWRGFLIAQQARDSYGGLLAAGVTCWLGYQALINMAVITAVIPFTGIPMPFLSYGGTSMAMSLVAVGVLLNVSRDAAMSRDIRRLDPRPQGEMRPEPPSATPRPSTTLTQLHAEGNSESISLRRRHRGRNLPRFSRYR